ncbi:MAG: sugar ABC transporter permease [Anaerolineales bacterium]
MHKEHWFYLLITPWLIGLIAFFLLPLTGALGMTLFEWHLPQSPQWVGAQHFIRLTADPLFSKTLQNNLLYALGSVPLGLALALFLATQLHTKLRSAALLQTTFVLPAALTGVATTLLWGWVFNPRYGLINTLLAQIDIRGPGWLQDEHWAMPALILISLWSSGINLLVYRAALQTIPAELYEAAALDGATPRRRFWHITLPLLRPVSAYLAVVNFIGALQLFTPVYLLTGGGPNYATLTLPLYIYQNAFAWGQIGYAAALAACLLLITLIFAILQLALWRGDNLPQ